MQFKQSLKLTFHLKKFYCITTLLFKINFCLKNDNNCKVFLALTNTNFKACFCVLCFLN